MKFVGPENRERIRITSKPMKVAIKSGIVFGEITDANLLKFESLMPENGVIFSDGIKQDFNSGCVLTVRVSEACDRLVCA